VVCRVLRECTSFDADALHGDGTLRHAPPVLGEGDDGGAATSFDWLQPAFDAEQHSLPDEAHCVMMNELAQRRRALGRMCVHMVRENMFDWQMDVDGDEVDDVMLDGYQREVVRRLDMLEKRDYARYVELCTQMHTAWHEHYAAQM
jgi:hypothetical protein